MARIVRIKFRTLDFQSCLGGIMHDHTNMIHTLTTCFATVSRAFEHFASQKRTTFH